MAILAGVERSLNISLFVQPEVKSLNDLKGRVLGVDTLTTGFAFILRKTPVEKYYDMACYNRALQQ